MTSSLFSFDRFSSREKHKTDFYCSKTEKREATDSKPDSNKPRRRRRKSVAKKLNYSPEKSTATEQQQQQQRCREEEKSDEDGVGAVVRKEPAVSTKNEETVSTEVRILCI